MDNNASEIPFSLSVKLIRFDERFAVLGHEMLGEFKWPIKNLPENLKIGDMVILKVNTEKTEADEKYTRMRKLLEELIN